MYPILEKKTPRRGHLADEGPRTARGPLGAARTIRHRARRRTRRAHSAHDLRFRRCGGQRDHRHAGHRRLDAQNLRTERGRCPRRLRRSAGPPFGIRQNACRRAAPTPLPLRGGRRGHGPGLPAGQMAPGTRREGRRHHRRQDTRHADLHRRHARRSRKPPYRHRRRFGGFQGDS